MICSLLGEGNRDRALLPVVRWVLQNNGFGDAIVRGVDTGRLSPRRTLAEKVQSALILQPCDVLFVHRDCDREPHSHREQEIRNAVADTQSYVPIVPVRMTEAWLLFDEGAIRAAVGRVSGKMDLNLPKMSHIERIADPKKKLRETLMLAYGRTGRSARRFRPESQIYRLSELIEDWSPLRGLPSFQRFEHDTREALETLVRSR